MIGSTLLSLFTVTSHLCSSHVPPFYSHIIRTFTILKHNHHSISSRDTIHLKLLRSTQHRVDTVLTLSYLYTSSFSHHIPHCLRSQRVPPSHSFPSQYTLSHSHVLTSPRNLAILVPRRFFKQLLLYRRQRHWCLYWLVSWDSHGTNNRFPLTDNNNSATVIIFGSYCFWKKRRRLGRHQRDIGDAVYKNYINHHTFSSFTALPRYYHIN